MSDQPIAKYKLGTLSREQLQAEIDAELASEDFLNIESKRLGVPLSDLESVTFKVESEGGFVAEGILIGILVGTSSKLAADGIKALLKIVVKRIRDRKGDDAIGDEEADTSR